MGKWFDAERAPSWCALDAVEFEVDVDVAGAAAGGNVADDDEVAEMARKQEWAEWLEKVVAHDRWPKSHVAGCSITYGFAL
jgi:hypothetical protein